MHAYGGMVSFTVEGGQRAAIDVCERARLFISRRIVGWVESLIEHPGLMTHASVSGSQLEVPPDLVRLSGRASRPSTTCSADLDQALA